MAEMCYAERTCTAIILSEVEGAQRLTHYEREGRLGGPRGRGPGAELSYEELTDKA